MITLKNTSALLFTVLCFLTTSLVCGQVGINNTSPNATLDITATNMSTPTVEDGILIPRVDEFPASDPGVSQDGMLVFLTGNGTPSKGFYYWDNGTTSWVSFSSDDVDWYESGTTTAPSAITDDIFHMGDVAVGKNTANYPLDVESNSERGISLNTTSSNSTDFYGIYSTLSGTGTGNLSGIYNEIDHNLGGTGSHFGIQNHLDTNTNNTARGTYNRVVGSGSGLRIGSQQQMGGSSTGPHTGNYNIISNANDGLHAGTHNIVNNGGDGTHIGTRNQLQNGGTGPQYGVQNEITNTADGDHYGTYSLISNSGDGNHFGTYNDFLGYGSGTKYGVYNEMAAYGENYGLYSTFSGASNSNRFGVYNDMAGTGDGTIYGMNTAITNTGNGIHYGTRNRLGGNGHGDQYGIYNEITNSGFGEHYGLYNSMTGGGSSELYGNYNYMAGSGNGDYYGTYNRIINTGSGVRYANYAVMDGAGTGSQTGNFAALTGSSSGNQNGYTAFINNSGNGNHHGIYSYLDGAGSGNKFGHTIYIPDSAGGAHYGVYSIVTKPGNYSYAGYFLGDVAIGSDHSNIYTLPPSRGTNGQVMQTDGSGNVSWATLNTSVTANNGISAAANNVSLGGGLVQNTTISHNNFSLMHNLNGTGDFVIQDLGLNHFEVRDNGNAYFGGDTYWFDENTSGTLLASLTDLGDDANFYLYSNGASQHYISTTGNTVFNEQGLAINFTIESDTEPYQFITRGDLNRIGIMTAAPSHDLTIKQSNTTQASAGGLGFEHPSNTDDWKIYHSGSHLSFAENGVRRAYVEAGTGNYMVTSDRRLKKNIGELSDVAEKVMALKMYSYHYKDQDVTRDKNLGFMAQEVQQIFPEAVTENEEGFLSINYDIFAVLAIKTIQEQQQQLNELNDKIDNQAVEIQKINDLSRRIQALEQER